MPSFFFCRIVTCYIYYLYTHIFFHQDYIFIRRIYIILFGINIDHSLLRVITYTYRRPLYDETIYKSKECGIRCKSGLSIYLALLVGAKRKDLKRVLSRAAADEAKRRTGFLGRNERKIAVRLAERIFLRSTMKTKGVAAAAASLSPLEKENEEEAGPDGLFAFCLAAEQPAVRESAPRDDAGASLLFESGKKREREKEIE